MQNEIVVLFALTVLDMSRDVGAQEGVQTGNYGSSHSKDSTVSKTVVKDLFVLSVQKGHEDESRFFV
jgi:hypothetical protein